jgi:hypothetical protein
VVQRRQSYVVPDTKEWIQDLLNNTARVLDSKRQNIFHDRFAPLMHCSAHDVFADILKTLFNVDSRQRLKVVNLKNSKGELLLRVGSGEPFGLINIGNDAVFFKETENPDNIALFDTEADEFGSSMFGTLNSKNSDLHILLGSRKFTEGWNSWRVSTMGLLNMGQGEGSQIIQLFGRGVRLKGKDHSLKRSTPNQRPKGMHLELLETLNIFGVNAGYMATFKQYLREEGITPTDEMIELDFETASNMPKTKIKTLALKDGYKDNQIKGFKRTHFPLLYEVPSEFRGKIKEAHIELDMYPKVEAMSSTSKSGNSKISVRNKAKIAVDTMALFDFDRIYMAVQEFKQLRSWSNLRIDRNRLIDFCMSRNDWYTLYVPQTELNIFNIADIGKQEEILIRLLQDYTDRFYKSIKTAYEGQFYQIVSMKEDDDSYLKIYHFEIDNNDDGQEYEKKLRALQVLVKSGKLGEASQWHAGQMVAICFDRHMYYPLFAFDGPVPLKMSPLSFGASSEVQFVRDLESFYRSAPGQQAIGKRSLYLLRNADTKAKGLGFALAGNFYPDYLLWLVDDVTGKQWLSFIDPKGLRQMQRFRNPGLCGSEVAAKSDYS